MNKNFKDNIDIICISLSRDNSVLSSTALSFAKELSVNSRVFFINHPSSWKDFLNPQKKGEFSGRKGSIFPSKNLNINPLKNYDNLFIIEPPLTLPINSIKNGNIYSYLSKINNSIIEKIINQLIERFNIKEYVFINFYDPFFLSKIPDSLKPITTVYYCNDSFREVDYFQNHGLRLEDECIRDFDITLCTSSKLVEFKSPLTKKVYLLPNGANTLFFNKTVYEDLPRPEDLKNITTQIIGFTGSIEFRMDFELLRKIALDNPEKTLVLVGPIDTDNHKEYELEKLSNVVFLGPKKYAELPNYLKYFDCGIIPYKKIETTESIYPLKINEYLAAGLPVVAISFSKDIQSFRPVSYIVDTHDEFLRAIKLAIQENSKDRVIARTEFASTNSWTARIKEFWEIVNNQLNSSEKLEEVNS